MVVSGLSALILKAEMSFSAWKQKNYGENYVHSRHIYLSEEEIEKYKNEGYKIRKILQIAKIKQENNEKISCIIEKKPQTYEQDYFLFKLIYIAERTSYEDVLLFLERYKNDDNIKIPKIYPCLLKNNQCNLFCDYFDKKCNIQEKDINEWKDMIKKYHYEENIRRKRNV